MNYTLCMLNTYSCVFTLIVKLLHVIYRKNASAVPPLVTAVATDDGLSSLCIFVCCHSTATRKQLMQCTSMRLQDR